MLLRARTPERRWSALWPVVEPLRGRVGTDELDTFSDLLTLLDDAALDDVDRALHAALRSLDTERHAAALSGTPWRGPEQPFSVRRFQRARERVVASGPEAMSAVATDPSRIADYDTSTAAPPTTPLRSDGPSRRIADELLFRGLLDRPRPPLLPIAARRGRWPSLRRTHYAFARYDPDHVWLRIDAVVGGAWRRAVTSAGALVINRLGATRLAPLDGAPLWSLELDLAPWGRRPVNVTTGHGTLSIYASVDDDPHGLPAEIARVLNQAVYRWAPPAQYTLADLRAHANVSTPGHGSGETAGPPDGGLESHRSMLSVPRRGDEAGPHEQSSIAPRHHDSRPAQGLR